MCSNFGLNLHPDRPPAAIENRVYYSLTRWIAWLRITWALRRRGQLLWK